ncbi:MAG: hypothetical protein OXT67_00655 [Zetaproteobacteria bacterium]|nr:hypothetical protein [Zetaproteobacteria bacterium]
MKSVHEKVRFPCNICKKSFASRSYLKQHSCKGNKKKLEEHPNNSTAHLREHPTSSHIEENRVTEFTDHGSGIQDLSLNIEELYSPPSFEETAQNSETTQQPICFQGLKWDMTEMDLVQILEESEASEPACKKMRFPDPLEDF